MASFISKKKKYKFQVEIILEELLEVPFVSAVLFAKLRLLDGGNFQDHSRREEVRDHTVKWNARYEFPCKMLANASTGVLERCVLRISIRKECKGGRSFIKLGFVDLNLTEFAGAGVTCKKALLEGYDTRHRQDNSMLKLTIKMNMLAGDILFKVPSPASSSKLAPVPSTMPRPEDEPSRIGDEYSGGSSLAGSIASGSSGFGSLPKKRPALMTSELLIGQTLVENNTPVTAALENEYLTPSNIDDEANMGEPGHSRNSSNTSQMSKASGYSSIHSHSRQSSSGDSGHMRLPAPLANQQSYKCGNRRALVIPSTFAEDSSPLPGTCMLQGDVFATPRGSLTPLETSTYYTPPREMPPPAADSEPRLRSGIVRSQSDHELGARIWNDPFVRAPNDLVGFVTPMASRKHTSTPVQYRSVRVHTCQNGFTSNRSVGIGHRKMVIESASGKQHLVTVSPEEGGHTQESNCRRTSITQNPSSGSLPMSETGSLDRAKAALERRKKTQSQDGESAVTSGRVENTRVNTDVLIDELIKSTNLDKTDESAESSGLQLFIAKDGTAALGSHEVKSQMSSGVFKQVVVDEKR